jgi:hypothetical protein
MGDTHDDASASASPEERTPRQTDPPCRRLHGDTRRWGTAVHRREIRPSRHVHECGSVAGAGVQGACGYAAPPYGRQCDHQGLQRCAAHPTRWHHRGLACRGIRTEPTGHEAVPV